jgi:hypothetical protein
MRRRQVMQQANLQDGGDDAGWEDIYMIYLGSVCVAG